MDYNLEDDDKGLCETLYYVLDHWGFTSKLGMWALGSLVVSGSLLIAAAYDRRRADAIYGPPPREYKTDTIRISGPTSSEAPVHSAIRSVVVDGPFIPYLKDQ